jgi:molybdopterin converting factor small subunit/GNAT superfamily N-acetyltransferase
MTIQLLFFAQARERAGGSRATLELPDGSRVRDALAKIRERYPALVELMPHLAVAMNQRLVGEEEAIVPGAELALLPPVSGGAPKKAPRAAGAVHPQKKPAAGAAGSRKSAASLRVTPATPARWADLEKLFGLRGACAGCWCMWCRLPGKEFRYGRGLGNKRRLRRLVNEGPPPGLIGYLGTEPVAWCAIGPREHFQRLSGSRTLAPVDDRPVWSVPCFFVARAQRRSGLTARMLGEAAKFAKARGASILEGYPIEPGGKTADAFAWWGLVGAFEKAGFDEVLRRSPTHPIMRRRLRGRSAAPKPRARPRG